MENLKISLQKADQYRDRVLFVFIKPFWPRFITPNLLTFTRFIISIVLFISLFLYNNDSAIFIVPLFLVGVLTDLFDGSVARGLHLESHFGAIADPIADRFLILPIAIYSLLGNNALLLLVLATLEAINAWISVVGQTRGIFIESNIFGKVKMFLQSIVFLAILVFWPHSPNVFFIWLLWISAFILVVSIRFKILELK